MEKSGFGFGASVDFNTRSRTLTVVHESAILSLLDKLLVVEGVISAKVVPHWRGIGLKWDANGGRCTVSIKIYAWTCMH